MTLTSRDYIRDGDEIYRRSFAIIRAEADLIRFAAAEERVAVRVIHACGMAEIVRDLVFHPDFTSAASGALKSGAPILCDAKMVANGITRSRLPAKNEIVCTLNDPGVPELAVKLATTKTAAALEFWRPILSGSLVVIGNAPTALFRLLDMLDEGADRPAAIIGMPVGFVGAAESKQALIEYGRIPYSAVRGRKGGSAMAVAALNAIASERE
jgi:precorrin-8X/cobalt-precorrin-8 methylmutase